MKVSFSVRATSLRALRCRLQPGSFFSSSRMKSPPRSASSVRRARSFSLPSHQTTRSGRQRRSLCSTQASSVLFAVMTSRDPHAARGTRPFSPDVRASPNYRAAGRRESRPARDNLSGSRAGSGVAMNRWVKRLAVLAVLVAAGAAIKLTLLRAKPVPVTIYRVARGTVEETVSNSKAGTVTARRRAKISPQIGGQVEYLGPRKGVPVKEGEVLLRIVDHDLRAGLALAREDVSSADAAAREACYTADQAARDLKRNENLRDDRIIPESLLEQLRSTRDASAARCDAARAAAGRAKAAVGLAQANLEKATLRAPFDGIVADLKAELGEWVSPSPPALPIPPVYDIIDPTSIYVSAPIDEVDAGKVKTGQPARLTLDPFPGKSFPGKVVRVAPYVIDLEQQNRTLEIEVEFDDTSFSRTLLPGTSADCEVILKHVDAVLRLPSYAILEGGKVLVLDAGRLVARPITTGLRNWEYAEATDGLREGDPVVVSLDRAEVKEGARAVETTGPAAPPAGT